MKTLRLLFVLLTGIVVLAPAVPAAQRTTLNLATMAPSRSVWELELRSLATAWQRTGSVRVVIHPGGALGSEIEVADTIRARRPTPELAALSAIALSHVDDAFDLFGAPFFFASYEELYHVLDAMTPTLRKRLDDRGLVHLAWGHVGWAHVFSKKPVTTLDELKKLRLWTSGDDAMVRWYRSNGFHVEQSSLADLGIALQSGKIEAIPISPLIANANQWYRHTGFMLDLGIAPIIGAVVIAKPVWNAFSETDRRAFQAAATEMENKLKTAVPDQDRSTVAALRKRGQLTVTKPAGTGWQAAGESLADILRGGSADIYDEALKARNAYRQKKRP